MDIFVRRNKLVLLSLATGVLLAASWPARGFPFLAFFALIPLLVAEDHLLQHRSHYRSIMIFIYAWAAFLVFNLLTTWWIAFATVPGMIAAVLLNSGFMAVPWWLMHLSRRILPGRQSPFSIVLLWLAFEHLHAQWELSWSWLDLGNVFATAPVWVQWYSFTGTAGGSLWVLVINLLLFFALSHYLTVQKLNKRVLSSILLALAAFTIPSVISFGMWRSYEETNAPVNIVIVQPSEDPYKTVTTRDELRRRMDAMLALADSHITDDTRFVAAPEDALPEGVWMHEAESHYSIQRIREHLSQHPEIAWFVGGLTYRLIPAGETLPPEARPLNHSSDFYVVYNSVLFIEEGQPVQYYHKSKLVPGIERMPYFRYLKPLNMLVERLGGISGSLGTQEARRVFDTQTGIAAGAAVCYESIYGEYMTEYIRRGADILIIVTNDGWWRNTPGHRQHLQYARLRAVETRRSIARAASTGVSAFINQRGEITAKTSWWEATALNASINKNNRITFYALSGNFTGKLSVFLSALLVLYMLSQRMISRKR